MVNPAVTVLMTVYDSRLDQLNAAIGSVLAQTLGDFEFLIINDGGRDESVRVQLDSWASQDKRVHVYHEPHRGVAGSSNRGLTLARGEFVARHDSDDWSEPGRVARQVAFLRANPKITLAGTDTLGHSSDGRPLWRLRLPHASSDVSEALWRGNPFVHGSTMFRRRTALDIGGYREQFLCSEDYDFLWRLTEAGGAVNLDEVLYHYRFTSGSISARRAVDQAQVHRAAHALAAARRIGAREDIALALAEAGERTDSFRASLKQVDHIMLAGDYFRARQQYARLLRSRPWSGLAWAKLLRLFLFAAIPPVREACFR